MQIIKNVWIYLISRIELKQIKSKKIQRNQSSLIIIQPRMKKMPMQKGLKKKRKGKCLSVFDFF